MKTEKEGFYRFFFYLGSGRILGCGEILSLGGSVSSVGRIFRRCVLFIKRVRV